MDPFSGPKSSPLDAKKYPSNIYQPKLSDLVNDVTNYSTGALATGIGFGLQAVQPGMAAVYNPAVPASVNCFSDDVTPGQTMPNGTVAPDARLMAIGGGRSTPNTVAAPSVPQPYNAQPILAFGNGGGRDAGVGPIFTGFGIKFVTSLNPVPVGAAVEGSWLNRMDMVWLTGYSGFGSNSAASPAVV
jgi:hypothetical protein